jgi:hypothetical protein
MFLASPSAKAQQGQSLSLSAPATALVNTTSKGTVTLTDAWIGSPSPAASSIAPWGTDTPSTASRRSTPTARDSVFQTRNSTRGRYRIVAYIGDGHGHLGATTLGWITIN